MFTEGHTRSELQMLWSTSFKEMLPMLRHLLKKNICLCPDGEYAFNEINH